MESSINERIAKIIQDSGKTINAFAKHIGIAQTSLRDVVKGNTEPKFSTIQKIAIAVPSINIDWLITGIGESSLDKINNKFEKISNSAVPKYINTFKHDKSIVGEHTEEYGKFENESMKMLIETTYSQQKTINTLTEMLYNSKKSGEDVNTDAGVAAVG